MSAQARSDVEAALSRFFGIVLLVTGAALAIWAVVAIADSTTPLLRWHVYLLAWGIIVSGWGVPLVIPSPRRQAALGAMVLVTPLVCVVAYFIGATIY